MIESWRKVWRNGFSQVIDLDGLLALRRALIDDDQRLIQGATTSPPPLSCRRSWPAESACAVGFCRLRGNNETVSEIEDYFGATCFAVDNLIGEPGDCRHFLNWFDDTPRDIMRRELLAEVELAIREKELDRPSPASPARCLELTARAGWRGANHRLVAGERPAR